MLQFHWNWATCSVPCSFMFQSSCPAGKYFRIYTCPDQNFGCPGLPGKGFFEPWITYSSNNLGCWKYNLQIQHEGFSSLTWKNFKLAFELDTELMQMVKGTHFTYRSWTCCLPGYVECLLQRLHHTVNLKMTTHYQSLHLCKVSCTCLMLYTK